MREIDTPSLTQWLMLAGLILIGFGTYWLLPKIMGQPATEFGHITQSVTAAVTIGGAIYFILKWASWRYSWAAAVFGRPLVTGRYEGWRSNRLDKAWQPCVIEIEPAINGINVTIYSFSGTKNTAIATIFLVENKHDKVLVIYGSASSLNIADESGTFEVLVRLDFKVSGVGLKDRDLNGRYFNDRKRHNGGHGIVGGIQTRKSTRSTHRDLFWNEYKESWALPKPTDTEWLAHEKAPTDTLSELEGGQKKLITAPNKSPETAQT